MKRVKPAIPPNVVEKTIREYKHQDDPHGHRVTDCFLNGIRVGQRVYNRQGTMILETPIKAGLKHGWEFTWDDDGRLLLVEPYVKGKIHGTAIQYGRQGAVIGTYTLSHGTGFDIWRQETEAGTVFVSEIHSLIDGMPHGYEWDFASPAQNLWHERHWYMGKLHGIERIWNSKGKLRRGYPAFYVLDRAVSKQKYTKLSAIDETLPRYTEEDNRPHRKFPDGIMRGP